jgi:hypothetical protein
MPLLPAGGVTDVLPSVPTTRVMSSTMSAGATESMTSPCENAVAGDRVGRRVGGAGAGEGDAASGEGQEGCGKSQRRSDGAGSGSDAGQAMRTRAVTADRLAHLDFLVGFVGSTR